MDGASYAGGRTRKGKKKKKKELDAVGKYYKSLMAEAKNDSETSASDDLNAKTKKPHKKKGRKSSSTISKKKEKSNIFIGLSKLSSATTTEGLAKVHTPSDSSIKSTAILGIEILESSKIIWIEKSKANIGIFRVIPFEFNVFDNSGDRLLFVMPTIGSRENILGASNRPNTFCVHTYMGRDLCDIKYNLGHCCRKHLKAEIRIDDDTFAKVVQPSKSTDYLVYDADATVIMQISLNKNIKSGNKFGSKIFDWNVYLAKELTRSVGTISRNGPSSGDVYVGEPLGFYFRQREADVRHPQKVMLENQHKLVIVTILLGLSVMHYQN